MKSAKARGTAKFHAEVRAIMDKHGCDRKEALKIRRSTSNGAATALEKELNDIGNHDEAVIQKLTADQIGRATETRIEFLTATISGIRQQLEAYQEELGKLVNVAKALDIDVGEQAEMEAWCWSIVVRRASR
jgi:adenylate kinase family enzyme